MAVPIEEDIAALSIFSLEITMSINTDDQPEVQGPGFGVSAEGGATFSPIEHTYTRGEGNGFRALHIEVVLKRFLRVGQILHFPVRFSILIDGDP
ncbi:hypothetical protein KY289_019193 [Solanum tuberosum]|nr:hypothetical protein KY289_019193 [Solanum tuberosum]